MSDRTRAPSSSASTSGSSLASASAPPSCSSSSSSPPLPSRQPPSPPTPRPRRPSSTSPPSRPVPIPRTPPNRPRTSKRCLRGAAAGAPAAPKVPLAQILQASPQESIQIETGKEHRITFLEQPPPHHQRSGGPSSQGPAARAAEVARSRCA
ncbi:hypothetical protein ZWY2020_056608 [Hordeum vulgare]|nr:hypothetical protein ZWY2020_056608 [Hordeum vulgare]